MPNRKMFAEVFQSGPEIRSGNSYPLLNIKLPFPIKLHDMLEEMAAVGDASIVSWQPHGKAFRVHQPEVFARTVMPRYFRGQTKYKSFQRQLHIYGFHRIGNGMVDTGAYFHSMFIRNQKSMSLRMRCQKIKGTKSGNATDCHATGDPDFYSPEEETKVNSNLSNTLQADPILQASTITTTKKNKKGKEKKRGCRKDGQAILFTTDQDPKEAEQLLQSAPLLINEEDPDSGPSPPDQIIDWMEQAQVVLSFEEEHASPSYPVNFKLPFPIKLHDMLEEMAAVGDESIVSWQPHGKAFRVHQPDAFARTVMPRYFKEQTKYKSFQRQLHFYGFHRVRKGMDTGAYFHRMFIRNQKSMSLRMSCQKHKGKKSTEAVDHHAPSDPDFYSAENNVVNKLTNVLQADPILQATATRTKEKMRRCLKRRRPHHAEEDNPLLNNTAPLLFNQEVPGDGPSQPYELIEWMGQVETLFSSDEEQASPDHQSALLFGVNNQKHEEGFFEGKRFFSVVETKEVNGESFPPMFTCP